MTTGGKPTRQKTRYDGGKGSGKKAGTKPPTSNKPDNKKPDEKKKPKTIDEKEKKKGPGLKEVLSAAAELTSGGGGTGGVSATSQSYGGGNIPTAYTADNFWHPETTESGRVND